MNAGEANKYVVPESIHTCVGVLEINNSTNMTERFPFISALVSVNNRTLAFSYCDYYMDNP